MLPRQRSMLKSTWGSRSDLVMITISAARNMCGYFSGLSSPSVTESITTLAPSPRSNSAGHSDTNPGMIDRSETSPLEELAQLEDAADRGRPGAVAGLGHDAPVLVLDDAAFLGELTQNRCDRLQNVERLAPGDDDRLFVMLCNEPVGCSANDHSDMPRPEKPVQCQLGRVEDRFDRRNDCDVTAQQREIAGALALGLQYAPALGGPQVIAAPAGSTQARFRHVPRHSRADPRDQRR